MYEFFRFQIEPLKRLNPSNHIPTIIGGSHGDSLNTGF
jgi:hypothetical protein